MFRLPRDPVSNTDGMAVHWSRHIVLILDFLLPALILAAGTWLIRARGLDLCDALRLTRFRLPAGFPPCAPAGETGGRGAAPQPGSTGRESR